MLRCFVAADIPSLPGLQPVFERLQALDAGLRPVRSEQLHFTLRFLGDTEEGRVPELIELLTRAVEGEARFTVELRGLGAFPSTRAPRVVWVGARGAEPLERIAARLETELTRRQISHDSKRFRPHLTLARVHQGRMPQGLIALLEELREAEGGRAEIAAVHLKQSTLRPEGPIYTVLHTCELPQQRLRREDG